MTVSTTKQLHSRYAMQMRAFIKRSWRCRHHAGVKANIIEKRLRHVMPRGRAVDDVMANSLDVITILRERKRRG